MRSIDLVILSDTFADLGDALPDLLAELRTLPASQGDRERVHRIFRSLHTIKGNLEMARADQLVEATHAIEAVVHRVRERQLSVDPLLAEALAVAVRTLNERVEQALLRRSSVIGFSSTALLWLDQMASAPDPAAVADAARCLLAELTGLDPAFLATPGAEVVTRVPAPLHGLQAPAETRHADDLGYFDELAGALENRFPEWLGRTDYQIGLACAINAQAGRPVPEGQLIAAIYLHDLGFAFIPDSEVGQHAHPDEVPTPQLKTHLDAGYGLAVRLPGWEEAAQIIRQHHEHFNGTGYPAGLKGDQIVPGARLLAIVDTYFSLTHGDPEKDYRRTLLRGVSAVNANSGSLYDPDWVRVFNEVIRARFLAHAQAAAAAKAAPAEPAAHPARETIAFETLDAMFDALGAAVGVVEYQQPSEPPRKPEHHHEPVHRPSEPAQAPTAPPQLAKAAPAKPKSAKAAAPQVGKTSPPTTVKTPAVTGKSEAGVKSGSGKAPQPAVPAPAPPKKAPVKGKRVSATKDAKKSATSAPPAADVAPPATPPAAPQPAPAKSKPAGRRRG